MPGRLAGSVSAHASTHVRFGALQLAIVVVVVFTILGERWFKRFEMDREQFNELDRLIKITGMLFDVLI